MKPYLKINEDKAPFIIHYIENYTALEVVAIMEKQDFDFQKFFNENPQLLVSMIKHFCIDAELVEKLRDIWKIIDYKFNDDDILYYMGEKEGKLNIHFYNHILDYIIDNGTNINFQKDGTTLMEKICKKCLKEDYHSSFSKFIEMQIKNKKWDVSCKDSNGKDSIDYLINVLDEEDNIKKYSKRKYLSKYKSIFLMHQTDLPLSDKESFLKKISNVDNSDGWVVNYIVPFLYLYPFKFIENEDLNMGMQSGKFLKKMIIFIEQRSNFRHLEDHYLLKMFETPMLNPDNSYLFVDEKNFRRNFEALSKITKEQYSYPSYAHLAYLYANKENVKNILNYVYLLPEVLEKMLSDNVSSEEDKRKVFNTLMDTFSYDIILDDETLNKSVKNFLSQATIKDREQVLNEYLMREERRNLDEIISTDVTVVAKNRL